MQGYKVQTWIEGGENNVQEIQVEPSANRALINKFIPHAKNFVRMYVHNGRYNGPPSETLSFDTPEGGTSTGLIMMNKKSIRNIINYECFVNSP